MSKVFLDPALLKPLPATAHRRVKWHTKFKGAPAKALKPATTKRKASA